MVGVATKTCKMTILSSPSNFKQQEYDKQTMKGYLLHYTLVNFFLTLIDREIDLYYTLVHFSLFIYKELSVILTFWSPQVIVSINELTDNYQSMSCQTHYDITDKINVSFNYLSVSHQTHYDITNKINVSFNYVSVSHQTHYDITDKNNNVSFEGHTLSLVWQLVLSDLLRY